MSSAPAAQIKHRVFLFIYQTIDPMYREGFRSWYNGEWSNLRYQIMFDQHLKLLTELFVDTQSDRAIADGEGDSNA